MFYVFMGRLLMIFVGATMVLLANGGNKKENHAPSGEAIKFVFDLAIIGVTANLLNRLINREAVEDKYSGWTLKPVK